MSVDTYQYEFVERLSFLRCGGTSEEARAAAIIKGEIEKLGGAASYMEFPIPACEIKKQVVKVTEPYEQELEVLAYGCSGSLPEGGVDLKLYYAGAGTEEDYLDVEDLSDSVVMIDALNYDAYKLLCKKHAGAFLVICNNHWDTEENADLLYRLLRPRFRENGVIPGFMIWAKDATTLVRDHAQTLHLELEAEDREDTSRNVTAVIPGTGKTGESIVLTAHYDSVHVGTGAWDNATGSAALLYIYRHFLKNPPRRTMRFIWCGSEELGLYGSKAFIEQQTELVEKEVKFCFNFDMCGTILGRNSVVVTGGDELKHFAEQFCREYGMSANINVRVHSSDSAPFADKGIPALGLSRTSGTCDIHVRNDVIFPLSAEQLEKDGAFAVAMISRVVNSRILPVPVGMPDDMKKELEKYFLRDKTTLAQDQE